MPWQRNEKSLNDRGFCSTCAEHENGQQENNAIPLNARKQNILYTYTYIKCMFPCARAYSRIVTRCVCENTQRAQHGQKKNSAQCDAAGAARAYWRKVGKLSRDQFIWKTFATTKAEYFITFGKYAIKYTFIVLYSSRGEETANGSNKGLFVHFVVRGFGFSPADGARSSVLWNIQSCAKVAFDWFGRGPARYTLLWRATRTIKCFACIRFVSLRALSCHHFGNLFLTY